MAIFTMIKSWFIAACLFVAAIVAALFVGKVKQHANDVAAAKVETQKALDKISKVQTHVKSQTDALPPTGPNSAADQLRNDWSE